MRLALIDHALPPALFERLRATLLSADIEPFNRHSYWFPWNARPRLLVEQAIAALARFWPEAPGVAGVEWWVEAPTAERGVRWHFDVDHEVLRREGRHTHPVFGGVLYFDSIGGATVIADQTWREGRHVPARPTQVLAYEPRPNRFGVFTGDLRHAVAAAAGQAGATRLTLPLNLWRLKPQPPTCQNPPYGHVEFAGLRAQALPAGDRACPVAATPLRLPVPAHAQLVERDDRPVWPLALREA